MKKLMVGLMVMSLAGAASAALITSDSFSYADGLTTNVSGGFWSRFSGTADNSFVAGGALEINQARADDVWTSLGGTYSSGSIYISFDLNVSTAPTAAGTYALLLAANSSTFRDRLYLTGGVAGVSYNLGIGNTSAGATWGSALNLGQTYSIFMRSDLDTDTTYLWVDPVNESSTYVSVTQASTANALYFGARQAAGEGVMTVDNLMIGTTFADVIPEPTTAALFGVAVGVLALMRKRTA